MKPSGALRSAGAAAALLLGMATWGAGAQDATTPVTSGVVTSLPVAIHSGACGEGGDLAPDPTYDIGLLGPVAGENEPPEDEDFVGVQLSPPVLSVEETLDVPLADIIAAPHAVVVHESATADGTYVACGQIGGVLDDGQLAIGLRPLNKSGYYGVAVFEQEQGVPVVGEEQTEVTVYLFQDQGSAGPLGAGASPAATPVP